MRQSKGFKLGTAINISLAVALLTALGFVIFYVQNRPPEPVTNVVKIFRETSNQPPVHKMDIYGPPSSPLKAPLGIEVGSDGKIYVADTGNNQIQVFDSDGRWVARFGKTGGDKVQFNYPIDILIRNNRLYVADMRNNRVQILGMDGKYIGQIPDPNKHKDLEVGPLSLAQDKDGNLYVAVLDHKVLVFDKNDNYVKTIGRAGRQAGQFNYPYGLAFDSQGRLWVSDSNNAMVQVLDPNTGKAIKAIADDMVLPRGIVIDSKDRVYVVDVLRHTVVGIDGNQFSLLFQFGERGLESGQFNFPNGIAMGPSGNLYIIDRENARISVWGR